MSHIEIHENRSFFSTIIGLLLICIAFASLLTIKGMSEIPETLTIDLLENEINFDVHGTIHLLATPARYVASLWGETSMFINIAFLFLGLGLSLIFKKKIASRLKVK